MVHGDGGSVEFVAADVIYVNAGATKPSDIWLDRLKDGGRLILPLTTDLGFTNSDWSNMHRRGAVFLITMRGGEFHARWVSPVATFPYAGMRDELSERALAEAFEKGDPRKVTWLHRGIQLESGTSWVRGPGWSLSYSSKGDGRARNKKGRGEIAPTFSTWSKVGQRLRLRERSRRTLNSEPMTNN